jgi:hypothetical protein
MLRGILIRLYPRHWRQRYGEEFGRLLDDTPLSALMIANVLGAAAREWLLRTVTGYVVVSPVLAYCALISAQFLSTAVGAEPSFSFEGVHRIVTPPWPVSLGVAHPLIGFALLTRVGVYAWRQTRTSQAESAAWTFCLFVGAVCQQWALLETNQGTGLEPWSPWSVWSYAAVDITSKMMFLQMMSKDFPQKNPYRSFLQPPGRPLGLS